MRHFDNGEKQEFCIKNLDDGSHFGEFAMMETDAKLREIELNQSFASPFKEQPEEEEVNNENDLARRFEKIENLISQSNNQNCQESKAQENKFKINLDSYKRKFSVQCAEETELLGIDINTFEEIVFSVIHKEMDEKIRILRMIPFLQVIN